MKPAMTPILSMFAPRTVRPPSPKNKPWIKINGVKTRTAPHGLRSIMAIKAAPTRPALVPNGTGMLKACITKANDVRNKNRSMYENILLSVGFSFSNLIRLSTTHLKVNIHAMKIINPYIIHCHKGMKPSGIFNLFPHLMLY